jgi:hypothetical protein
MAPEALLTNNLSIFDRHHAPQHGARKLFPLAVDFVVASP